MPSQFGADAWVQRKSPQPGFFLDIGAGDAIQLSNTDVLEKQGWRGLCIDAMPTNFHLRPNTLLHKAVLWNEAGKEVSFLYHPPGPGLSGVEETLDRWRDRVSQNHIRKTFITETIGDVLGQYDVPAVIDYMSLDVEGAELKVLESFPFDKYTVRLLTVEHNFEEPKRTEIQQLLTGLGYVLRQSPEADDWFELVQ